jgi:hypothetical protein
VIAPHKRDKGPGVTAATIIVLEEPPTRPAPPGRGGEDHLDITPFIGDARAAALKREGPIMRAQVTVDEELMELPHDAAAALRDFVECLYVLYGWQSVIDVDKELRMMLKLRQQPDQVARESGLPIGAPSGGVAVREGETGPVIGPPRTTTPRGESLPGGVLLQEVPPASAGVTQEQLRTRARYDMLRRRVVLVSTPQIEAWVSAFSKAFADLREIVLLKMQTFEREALEVANKMLFESREQVAYETARYFQWHARHQVEAALNSTMTGPHVRRDQKGVVDLRTRLTKLRPLAQAVVDAEDAEKQYREPRTVVMREEDLPPNEKAELARLRAEIEAKKAVYGTALVVEAADHPVLFRFDAATALKASAADDGFLGELVFKRLKKTWRAADAIREQLVKHQAAKDVKRAELSGDHLPESLIGREAKQSVWAYPRLLEKTFAGLAPDEFGFLEVAIPNTRAALAGVQREDALMGIVAGIGLAGLQLGMIAVCPPAGIALDVALSAVDVAQAVEDYEKGSNEARCVLDPREALSEAEPSVVPLVFAVAGAALVAV